MADGLENALGRHDTIALHRRFGLLLLRNHSQVSLFFEEIMPATEKYTIDEHELNTHP
jgi:hypothetical protein